MRNTSAFLVITALLTPFVAARMHHSAVCITYVGEAKVYAEETTKKACEGYHNRDTGDEKWDKCPDCQMMYLGNMNVCHSADWHMGGDEINHYCKKFGAHDSVAN